MIDLNAAKGAATKLKTANAELDSAISKLKKAKQYVELNGRNELITPVITSLERNITELGNLKTTINNTGDAISTKAQQVYDAQVAAANTYTVVKGDTLSAIAKKYKTTVAALKKLNGLTSNVINIGQKIKIK